jgi:hypothetical protein
MKKSNARLLFSVVGGLLLIAAGVVFLLDNLELITLDWEMLIGPLFGVGGLVFLLVFILNTEDWWALIPGFALLGIGVIIFMGQQEFMENWTGAVFLGFLSIAFFLVYFFHHSHWWALIPGGVLLTLSGVTLLPEDGVLAGGVFFLGMALTFVMVYIAPKPSGKLKWALYPAAALLVIGLLATLGATNLINYVWPLGLLAGGGYLIYRAVKKH